MGPSWVKAQREDFLTKVFDPSQVKAQSNSHKKRRPAYPRVIDLNLVVERREEFFTTVMDPKKAKALHLKKRGPAHKSY